MPEREMRCPNPRCSGGEVWNGDTLVECPICHGVAFVRMGKYGDVGGWSNDGTETRTVSVSRLVEIRQLLDAMCARDGADTATLVRDWLDEVIGGDDESR
jgi:hypothetical protein